MINLPIYNFVILGKSGIGKSSLINYFFNSEIEKAKVGQGKPVTGKVFEKYDLTESNLNINIYDSWGIEGGKTNEWLNYFSDFIKKTKTDNISDWIHTALYCISGETKRIEDFEIQIIKELINEKLNPIIVITKADLSNNKDFIDIIKKEFSSVPIVEICSISKQVGLGSNKKISNQNGREELLQSILLSCKKSIEPRLKDILISVKEEAKKQAIENINKKLDLYLNENKNIIGNLSIDKEREIIEILESEIKNIDNEIHTKMDTLVNNIENLYGTFYNITILKSNKSIDLKYTNLNNIKDELFDYKNIVISLIPIIGISLLGFKLKNIPFWGTDIEKLKQEIMKKVEKHYS